MAAWTRLEAPRPTLSRIPKRERMERKTLEDHCNGSGRPLATGTRDPRSGTNVRNLVMTLLMAAGPVAGLLGPAQPAHNHTGARFISRTPCKMRCLNSSRDLTRMALRKVRAIFSEHRFDQIEPGARSHPTICRNTPVSREAARGSSMGYFFQLGSETRQRRISP